jgi:Tol biopolymer transport system component
MAKKPPKPPPDPEPDPDPAIAFVQTFKFGIEKVMVMNGDGSNLTVAFDGEGADIGGRVDWSPDGNKLVFWSDYDGQGIYVYDLAAESLTKVCATQSSMGALFRPAWSPGAVPGYGECIAFEDQGTSGVSDIYLVEPVADSTPIQLTDTELVFELNPTWSPSGELLVFNWSTDDYRTGDKYVVYDFAPDVGPPTYTVRRHQGDLQGVGVGTPAFSKTREDRVAWVAFGDVWVVDIDATEDPNTRLTNTTDKESRWPSWSPDDAKIVFMRADVAGGKWLKNHRLVTIEADDGSGLTTIHDDWGIPTWRR